jgi:chromosomal replication initiator protein
VSDVKRVICRERGLTVLDLEGQSRFPAVVRARQVGMYLARQLSAKSFTDIGRFFGDRDHTTALHAYNKIKRLRSEDADLDRELAQLESRIGAASAASRPQRDAPHAAKD